MEANFKTDKKTPKHTEGAAAADRAKYNGDSSSAKRVDHGPTSLTSFDKIAEPSLAPEKCIVSALVYKCVEVPKPHLPPVEVRMLSSAAGGLLPAGTSSTAMRAIFSRPLASWTLGEETKERISRTGRNQLAPPCWRRVIQTK